MLLEINCSECEEYKDELYELGVCINHLLRKLYYFYCKECLEKKKIEFTFKDCEGDCGNQILSSSCDEYCFSCDIENITFKIRKIEDPVK